MNSSMEGRVRHGQGKVVRIRDGLPHFATVEVTLCWPAQELSIAFDCHGQGWLGQGIIEEVSAEGYDDWKQGASLGIRYALARCSTLPCHITVTRIEGLTTDTNPTIVGIAAIQAVWSATEYKPSAEEHAFIEQLLSQSWQHVDSLADMI